ncbi:MAG: CopG family transcriptional regulator [Myxococcota bacterium]
MGYARTQVYLDPEDHQRLREEARKQGRSMTDLLREIVHEYVRTGMARSEPQGFDSIIGVTGDDAAPTDVSTREQEYLDEAQERRLRKKLGRRE